MATEEAMDRRKGKELATFFHKTISQFGQRDVRQLFNRIHQEISLR